MPSWLLQKVDSHIGYACVQKAQTARHHVRNIQFTVSPVWPSIVDQGKLALAGPFADNEGGLFVYNAPSREEALSLLAQDPFCVEGVFKDYQLLEWLIEGVRPDLLVGDFGSEPGEEQLGRT